MVTEGRGGMGRLAEGVELLANRCSAIRCRWMAACLGVLVCIPCAADEGVPTRLAFIAQQAHVTAVHPLISAACTGAADQHKPSSSLVPAQRPAGLLLRNVVCRTHPAATCIHKPEIAAHQTCLTHWKATVTSARDCPPMSRTMLSREHVRLISAAERNILRLRHAWALCILPC